MQRTETHPNSRHILGLLVLLGLAALFFALAMTGVIKPDESDEVRRERALFELGCEHRDVMTWHQHKGHISSPKRSWVCDRQEVDDQLAQVLADERLQGGAKEWRQFRGQNEERRRIDSRP